MDSANEEHKEQRPDPDASPQTAKQVIRRAKLYSGRRVSAKDKIRIVMEGLRGEQTVTDLCRREPSRRQEDTTRGLTWVAASVKLTAGPQPGGAALPQVVRSVPFC